MTSAVVFDLDGLLIETEQLWDAVRRDVVAGYGLVWPEGATSDMQGMSAPEWSAYMHHVLGVPLAPAQVNDVVVSGLMGRYEHHLPLLPGAVEVVERLGRRFPLALASSSNRVIIDKVLDLMGTARWFRATVSSEEVGRGKPAPDVYLEAVRRLGTGPASCVALEDSRAGILSAAAAGLAVVAVPNREYPPPAGVLGRAAIVLESLEELTVEMVERLAGADAGAGAGGGPGLGKPAGGDRGPGGDGPRGGDRVDEESAESFPASDPPSEWAGEGDEL